KAATVDVVAAGAGIGAGRSTALGRPVVPDVYPIRVGAVFRKSWRGGVALVTSNPGASTSMVLTPTPAKSTGPSAKHTFMAESPAMYAASEAVSRVEIGTNMAPRRAMA